MPLMILVLNRFFFARPITNSKAFIDYSEPSIPTKILLTSTFAVSFDIVILRMDSCYVLNFLITAHYLKIYQIIRMSTKDLP